MTEPTLEVKKTILQQERMMWINTRYQIEIRLRVQQRIGGVESDIAELIKTLERCEKALDIIDEETNKLEVQ